MEMKEFGARVLVGTAGMTLAGSALLNAMPGEQSPLGFEVGGRDDKIVTETVPPNSEVVPAVMRTTREPGPELAVAVPAQYARDFRAAELPVAAEQQLHSYVQSVRAAAGESGTYTIQVLGEASDDDGTKDRKGDGNFGANSENNHRLAIGREKVVTKNLEQIVDASQDNAIIALGRSGVITELGGRESVLSPDEVAVLRDIASRRKLTLNQLRAQYNKSSSTLHLDSDEEGAIRAYVADHRGVQLTSIIERVVSPSIGPCDIVTTEHVIPGATVDHKMPGYPGTRIEFLPLPGYLPRRRKNSKQSAPVDDDTPPAHQTSDNGSGAAVQAAPAERQTDGVMPLGPVGVPRAAAEAGKAERAGRAAERTVRALLPIGAVALIGLLGLTPMFEHTEKLDAHTLPPKSEACQTTVDATPAERDVYMSSLWHMIYHGIIKHDGTGTKQNYVGRFADNPGSRTVTENAYTEYRVDGQGNLIQKISHPQNTYSYPLPSQK